MPETVPTPAERDWILALHLHYESAVNSETLAAVMGGRAGRNELLRIRDAWKANGWAAHDRARNNAPGEAGRPRSASRFSHGWLRARRAIYLTPLALELANRLDEEPVAA